MKDLLKLFNQGEQEDFNAIKAGLALLNKSDRGLLEK